MRHLYLYITLMFAIFMGAGTGCSDNEFYNDLPPEIRNFLAKYYPNTGVESYTHNAQMYHVKLKSSAGLTCDSEYRGEVVNGYGAALPQVFLYDQLPPALFDYLQETENLNAVMSAERTPRMYTVALLNDTVTYDIGSGRITEFY